MIVRYSSDHPDAVSVSHDGTTIRAVGAGPDTIMATVMYRGKTATGGFVVDVGGRSTA